MKSNFYLLFSILLLLGSVPTFAQIGIGTKTPAPSAALEVTSIGNNKGILIPRLTATQKDAIVSPAEGLLVYQTTAPIGFYYYSNTVWKLIVDQTELDNKLASAKTYVDDKIAAATIADADATTKGKIQLAGDLGGTAAAPTVPGLALKANTSNMTTALASKANTSDVTTGLALKANTSDVTTGLALKANTSDVTTALASKANISSLSTVATSGNYNDLANKPNIPSAYVMPKASASELGGVKVGANLSIDADGVLSAAASNSITGVVPVANGGTGTTSVVGIKSLLGFNSPSVAIGDQAGKTNQGGSTVGVGGGAGATNQGSSSVAVGYVAGYNNQGNASVAIGSNAAQSNQGTQAVALGFAAGQNGQGAYSVAVGSFAGNVQAANSIALNATGASLNPSTTGFYVAPIRNASASNSLFYDSATKEITYGTAAASGSGVPYTGATSAVNLGAYDLTVNGIKVGKGAGNVSTNTAAGSDALSSNTTGGYNTAVGTGALQTNLTGGFNTSVGTNALLNNKGNYNIAVGSAALQNNTNGESNTAMGFVSNTSNTTGSKNTSFGNSALTTNTTGSNNTAIGAESNVFANNLNNATAIGYQAVVAASNTIQLGNTSVTDVKTSGTITAGAVTYPKVDGTAGQVLTANGNGIPTWTTPSSGGGSTYTLPTASSMTLGGIRVGTGLTADVVGTLRVFTGSNSGLTTDNSGALGVNLDYNSGLTKNMTTGALSVNTASNSGLTKDSFGALGISVGSNSGLTKDIYTGDLRVKLGSNSGLTTDSFGALSVNLASPTFTGTPAAPTASAGTNTTQLATTAFVTTAIDLLKAEIATLKQQLIASGALSSSGGSSSLLTSFTRTAGAGNCSSGLYNSGLTAKLSLADSYYSTSLAEFSANLTNGQTTSVSFTAANTNNFASQVLYFSNLNYQYVNFQIGGGGTGFPKTSTDPNWSAVSGSLQGKTITEIKLVPVAVSITNSGGACDSYTYNLRWDFYGY